MQPNELTKRIINLQNKQYNFVIDKCPDEITFDMLMAEMTPDEPSSYTDSTETRNMLWQSYYIVCFSPNPFGLHMFQSDLNNMNDKKATVPWYTIPSDSKTLDNIIQ